MKLNNNNFLNCNKSNNFSYKMNNKIKLLIAIKIKLLHKKTLIVMKNYQKNRLKNFRIIIMKINPRIQVKINKI